MRKYLFILYGEVSWSFSNKYPIQAYRGTKLEFERHGKTFLESCIPKRFEYCEIRRAKILRGQDLCYDGNTEKTILIYKGGQNEKVNKNRFRCYRRGNFFASLCAVGMLGCQQIGRRSVQKRSHDTTMSGKDN